MKIRVFSWIPAFAGRTDTGNYRLNSLKRAFRSSEGSLFIKKSLVSIVINLVLKGNL
ncbi:MAG: hypothetical protein OXJ52_05130 [Oligoflexia bacterium]|nr:hypothetical protein [Oligoflexia bacterium]